MRVWRAGNDELVAAYAEMVPDLAAKTHGDTRLTAVDHLLERLRQVQTGEITIRVLDNVDRLHGELTHQP